MLACRDQLHAEWQRYCAQQEGAGTNDQTIPPAIVVKVFKPHLDDIKNEAQLLINALGNVGSKGFSLPRLPQSRHQIARSQEQAECSGPMKQFIDSIGIETFKDRTVSKCYSTDMLTILLLTGEMEVKTDSCYFAHSWSLSEFFRYSSFHVLHLEQNVFS